MNVGDAVGAAPETSATAIARTVFASEAVIAVISPDAFRPTNVEAATVSAAGVLSVVAYRIVFASYKDLGTDRATAASAYAVLARRVELSPGLSVTPTGCPVKVGEARGAAPETSATAMASTVFASLAVIAAIPPDALRPTKVEAATVKAAGVSSVVA